MRVIYLPLEPYRERYTEWTSIPNGVYERTFRDCGLDVLALRPDSNIRTIANGSVVDVVSRTRWGLKQTNDLIKLISNKKLDPRTDVIYIEDFWHPGFDMIPYAIHQFYGNVQAGPQIYSFMHAQTPDPNDFTYPMREWMRGMEIGWARAHNTVFCASIQNIEQWKFAGLPAEKLFPVGISFRSDVVCEVGNVPCDVSGLPLSPGRSVRGNFVVFSSRFDPEKNPDFFCDLVDKVMSERSDISFIATSSAPTLRGRDHRLLSRLIATQVRYPNNFEVRIGLTKEQYYKTLSSAVVQFNCAHQDFISYTLIEATMCGCIPLYPDWLTFPGALNFAEENMYAFGTPEEIRTPHTRAKSLASAVEKLYAIVDSSSKDAGNYDYVWQKYNYTVHRMAARMSNTSYLVTDISKLDAFKSADEVRTLLQKVHNTPMRGAH